MRRLVSTALRLRVVVAALAALLLVVGIRTATQTPLDVFPEFSPPLVEIQTEAPGLSTPEVESLVTVPVENALNGVSGLKTLRSKSVLGLSSVVAIFRDGADLMLARQLVQERLTTLAGHLPSVARAPVMLAPLSSTSRVMKIGVTSKVLSQVELTTLIRWTVRPRLMALPGVANVAIWGQRDRQIQVLVDPERLRAHDVTLADVVRSAGDAVIPAAGGFIETPNQRMAVTHQAAVNTAADLARVPVAFRAGSSLTLGDVAEVTEGHPAAHRRRRHQRRPGPPPHRREATRREYAVGHPSRGSGDRDVPAGPQGRRDRHDDLPACDVHRDVALEPQSGAAPRLPARDRRARALPDGVAQRIHQHHGHPALAAGRGARAALPRRDPEHDGARRPGHRPRRGGRRCDHRCREHRPALEVEPVGRGARARRSTLCSTRRSRSGAPSSTRRSSWRWCSSRSSSSKGLAGSFFRPLAASYVLAVGASLLVALAVTPALCLILLARAPLAERDTRFLARLKDRYRAWLPGLLVRPRQAAGAVVVLFAATLGGASLLGEEFMPKFKEYDFLMHWVEKPGTSLEAMQRITVRVSRELRAIPGVRNFGAHIGRAEVADEVVGPNFTELWISLDPTVPYGPTVEKIQQVVDGYPGLYRDLLTYLKERIKEVLTGGSAAIVVRVYGAELGQLRKTAADLGNAIGGIDGVADLKVEPQVLVPEIAGPAEAGRAAAVRPDARRRAAGRRGPGEGRQGRRDLRRTADLRCRGVGHGACPPRPGGAAAATHRSRRAAARCPWATWPTCTSRPRPTSSSAKTRHAASTWRATSRAATWAAWHVTSRRGFRRFRFSAGTMPRCSASTRRARRAGASSSCWVCYRSPGSRSCCTPTSSPRGSRCWC